MLKNVGCTMTNHSSNWITDTGVHSEVHRCQQGGRHLYIILVHLPAILEASLAPLGAHPSPPYVHPPIHLRTCMCGWGCRHVKLKFDLHRNVDIPFVHRKYNSKYFFQQSYFLQSELRSSVHLDSHTCILTTFYAVLRGLIQKTMTKNEILLRTRVP